MHHARALTLAVSAAALLAAPGIASAATVTVPPDSTFVDVDNTEYRTLAVGAAGNEVNTMTITGGGKAGNLVIKDVATTILVGATATNYCSGGGTKIVTCHPAPAPDNQPIGGIDVQLGGGADTFSDASSLVGARSGLALFGSSHVFVNGGAGDDTLYGNGLGESLYGGDGANTIYGGAGSDTITSETSTPGAVDHLDGGDGDDTIFAMSEGSQTNAGTGDDLLLAMTGSGSFDGWSGSDTVDFYSQPGDPGVNVQLAPGTATTTGNGRAGSTLSLTNVENGYGGYGNDTITGSTDANRIVGGGGNDTIVGGGGGDQLFGDGAGTDVLGLQSGGSFSPGADTIDAHDGTVDLVECGDTAGDALQADANDQISHCADAGLQLFPVVQTTPPGKQGVPPIAIIDRNALKAKLSRFTAAAPKAKALRRSGRFTVSLRSTQAAVGTVTLSGKAGSASIAKAGDLVLATKGTQLSGGKTRTVRLAIPKRLRKGLRRGRKLTLAVQLIDMGGGRTTKTRTVKLR